MYFVKKVSETSHNLVASAFSLAWVKALGTKYKDVGAVTSLPVLLSFIAWIETIYQTLKAQCLITFPNTLKSV